MPVVVTFKRNIDVGTIKLKALGNDAGVNVEAEGTVATDFVREEPQTAYIPGLAGLSEHETILAAPVFRRRAASGDGGSVLRQMLLEYFEPANHPPVHHVSNIVVDEHADRRTHPR